MTFKLSLNDIEGDSHMKVYGSCPRWSVDPLGILRPFQKINEVTTLLIIILRRYLFFSRVDICIDGANLTVGKTAGAVA